jgi:predicted TIM-barrel fold metal-dependent hydrolase
MIHRAKVIDVDAHMHEPQDLWERYIEPAYRARAPKVAYMDGTFMVYKPDGHLVPTRGMLRPPKSAYDEMEQRYGEAFRQWWSPQIRLSDMDQYGWDIQVLLPTGNNGNFAYFVALKDVEMGAAMCRAYNNWCHDYCSEDPARLKFVAILPGSDVSEMVKEARRAVENLGAVSIRNPLLPEGRWLHEREYDRLWALASDLDFPISVHGEYRQRRFQPFRETESDPNEDVKLSLRGLDHALGFPCDNVTTLGHFIFGGILERFPRLRIAVLESQAGWLPYWLGRLDDHTHGRHNVMGNTKFLPLLPSEYFVRQGAISCDSDERDLGRVVEYLQGSNIVWNTDYPHPDAMDPKTVLPAFQAQPISAKAKERILSENAIKLFGPRLLNG